MLVPFVVRDSLARRRQRRDVDQQMVMAGVFPGHAGRGRAHARQSEPHGDVAADAGAIQRLMMYAFA
jgi:hypothetical protein